MDGNDLSAAAIHATHMTREKMEDVRAEREINRHTHDRFSWGTNANFTHTHTYFMYRGGGRILYLGETYFILLYFFFFYKSISAYIAVRPFVSDGEKIKINILVIYIFKQDGQIFAKNIWYKFELYSSYKRYRYLQYNELLILSN